MDLDTPVPMFHIVIGINVISNFSTKLLFRCYLCGKETPSGSGNVLLHLRHHHPEEHTKVVDQVARGQLQRAAEQNGEQDRGVPGWRSPPSTLGEAGASSGSCENSPMVSIKKETLQIKLEINTDEDDPSY